MYLEKPKKKMLRPNDFSYLCVGLIVLMLLNIAHGAGDCNKVIQAADARVTDLENVVAKQSQLILEQKEAIAYKDDEIDAVISEGRHEKVEVGLAATVLTSLLFIVFVL